MSEFIIKSSISDLALVLSEANGDYFKASLQSSHLKAGRDVYAYTDGHGFLKMVEKLASYGGPWQGAEVWESLEGEFQFSAVCNATGQVTFTVTLSNSGCAEEWLVKTDLVSELGQLKHLEKSAREFFAPLKAD